MADTDVSRGDGYARGTSPTGAYSSATRISTRGSSSSVHACEYGCDTPYEELVVSIEEVTHAIEKLDLNKACGSDGICSEHLKYASNALVPLLGMCFTSFISHGFLPESMLSVMLVPVIKDKAGKISSMDNYRPIALASVISKLVEVIMLDRIEMYMITNPNQFGFKRNMAQTSAFMF